MSTTVQNVTGSQYQLVATGPVFLDVGNHSAGRLHFGDAAPAADTAAFVEIRRGLPFGYQGTKNTYVLQVDGDEALRLVVVTLD